MRGGGGGGGGGLRKKLNLALSIDVRLVRPIQLALFSLLCLGTCAGLVSPCAIGALVIYSGIGNLVNTYGKESQVSTSSALTLVLLLVRAKLGKTFSY